MPISKSFHHCIGLYSYLNGILFKIGFTSILAIGALYAFLKAILIAHILWRNELFHCLRELSVAETSGNLIGPKDLAIIR